MLSGARMEIPSNGFLELTHGPVRLAGGAGVEFALSGGLQRQEEAPQGPGQMSTRVDIWDLLTKLYDSIQMGSGHLEVAGEPHVELVSVPGFPLVAQKMTENGISDLPVNTGFTLFSLPGAGDEPRFRDLLTEVAEGMVCGDCRGQHGTVSLYMS